MDDILTPVHTALHRLATAPLPVVAAVNGPVAGAGIGLSPDVGASYFLARRVGAVRAQQWLMLSETIDAQHCLQHGVIDTLHPDAELADAAEALVVRLMRAASASLAGIKTLCRGLPARDLQAHLALEHQLLLVRARNADAQEGVCTFVEKILPRFTGV